MLAPNFFRGETTGIFRVEDLQKFSSTGATAFAPGTGSTEFLNFRSEIQNLTRYSWYWGNPTLKLEGTITVDGEELQIDSDQSRGYFERQWGEFGIAGGHYGYWLYLSNGILIHGWVVGPTVEEPYGIPAWATIWHPNGIHEVLEVDNTTKGLNPWTSEYSGNNYFQDVELNLSQRNASFNIHQVIKNGELGPLPGTKGYNISEAYAQGDGIWENERVTFYGHLEQLSYW
ncbi:unnamed protein product [Alternaria alternata]